MRPVQRTSGSSGAGVALAGVGVLALAGLVLAAAASRSGPLHLPHSTPLPHAAPRKPGAGPPVGGEGATGGDHAQHALLYVGVGLAVILGLVTLVALVRLLRQLRLGDLGWRLRRAPLVPPPAAAAEDDALVVRTVEAALAELQAGDSPRAAVIAAYAAMVGALADAGTPGAAGLTPVRLLARSAGVLSGDDAATLTALFERARFSEHPVTEADRADAQARLSAVLSRLTATAVG